MPNTTATGATASPFTKLCAYCRQPYAPTKWERPARSFCHKPSCESRREHDRRTPKPMLLAGYADEPEKPV